MVNQGGGWGTVNIRVILPVPQPYQYTKHNPQLLAGLQVLKIALKKQNLDFIFKVNEARKPNTLMTYKDGIH